MAVRTLRVSGPITGGMGVATGGLACSGQTGFNYHWGPDYITGYANINETCYPWVPDYKTGYANINETWTDAGPHYLQRTAAVGIYPQGDSLQGVSDLSGNVWEWCLNAYEKPANTQAPGCFGAWCAAVPGSTF